LNPKLNATFFPSSTPNLPEKKSFTKVNLAVPGAIFKCKLSDFFHNAPGPKLKYAGEKKAETNSWDVFFYYKPFNNGVLN